jgi:hypothetical protein
MWQALHRLGGALDEVYPRREVATPEEDWIDDELAADPCVQLAGIFFDGFQGFHRKRPLVKYPLKELLANTTLRQEDLGFADHPVRSLVLFLRCVQTVAESQAEPRPKGGVGHRREHRAFNELLLALMDALQRPGGPPDERDRLQMAATILFAAGLWKTDNGALLGAKYRGLVRRAPRKKGLAEA